MRARGDHVQRETYERGIELVAHARRSFYICCCCCVFAAAAAAAGGRSGEFMGDRDNARRNEQNFSCFQRRTSLTCELCLLLCFASVCDCCVCAAMRGLL